MKRLFICFSIIAAFFVTGCHILDKEQPYGEIYIGETVSWVGGDVVAHIIANGNWQIGINDDTYLNVSKQYGVGNDSVVFNIAANLDSVTRYDSFQFIVRTDDKHYVETPYFFIVPPKSASETANDCR